MRSSSAEASSSAMGGARSRGGVGSGRRMVAESSEDEEDEFGDGECFLDQDEQGTILGE